MEVGIAALAAVFAAYFVKGVAGFANTLVFSSIMNWFSRNVDIAPVELVLGIPSNVAMIVRNRRRIDLKVVVPLSLCVLAGMVPGVFLLKAGNDRILKIALGAVLIALGCEMLLRLLKGSQGRANRWLLLAVGTVSGVLIGVFGIGAFLVAYVSRTSPDADSFKGNLGCLFLAENAFRVALYAAAGILTGSVLLTALKLSPAMLLGFACGALLSKRLPERAVRITVAALLVLNGASLIAMSL